MTMADEQEIREIKETLQKLESRIEELTAAPKRVRSSWASFVIGFVIVSVVLIVSIGVLQFIKAD